MGVALGHELFVLLFIHLIKAENVLKQDSSIILLASFVFRRKVTLTESAPSQLEQNAVVLWIFVRLAAADHAFFLSLQLFLLFAKLIFATLVLLLELLIAAIFVDHVVVFDCVTSEVTD